MNVRRVKVAEWVAFTGAVGLLVTLPLHWFSVSTPELRPGYVGYAPLDVHTSGWSALGWLTVALLLACSALALALVAALAAGAADGIHTPIGVVLAALGPIALVVLAGVLVARPDLGVGLPDRDVSIEAAGWIGALCSVLLVAGALASERDERTSGIGRRFEAPAPRPAAAADSIGAA